MKRLIGLVLVFTLLLSVCFFAGCGNTVTEEQKQKAEMIYNFVTQNPTTSEIGFDGTLSLVLITLRSIEGDKILELEYSSKGFSNKGNEQISRTGPVTCRYYKYNNGSFLPYIGGDSLSLSSKTNVLAVTDWDTTKTKEQQISSLYQMAKEL